MHLSLQSTPVISLQQLLFDVFAYATDSTILLRGLALHSDVVRPGDAFFALKGSVVDGEQYIPAAQAAGAVAVFCEGLAFDLMNQGDCIVITVPQLRDKMGAIAAYFYGFPSQHMCVIGVTGTNGKTSSVYLMASLLHLLGRSAALLSTLGNGRIDAMASSANTTEHVLDVHYNLACFVQNAVQHVAVEVSSHAIAQQRIAGVDFDYVVLTNIGEDHLDYHGSVARYAETKMLLFEQCPNSVALVNIDDDYGLILLERLVKKKRNYIAFGATSEALLSHPAYIGFSDVHADLAGTRCTVTSTWGDGILSTRLLGAWNIPNILVALAIAASEGIAWSTLLPCFQDVAYIPGRMMYSQYAGGPLVIIDYAHEASALKAALIFMRAHVVGEIWTVFGCGGQRPVARRASMTTVAQQWSDHVVITADNPRDEPFDAIVSDMLSIDAKDGIIIEQDRAAAIRFALQKARPDDVVFIAGKGHESYQEIAGVRYAHSDTAVVKAYYEDIL